MSKQRLEGKVALITGGASGIGEEAARLFAEHGARIVIADIQDELGQKVAASIGPAEKASYHHCDVQDECQVESTVQYTLLQHGTLDILFSNAGVIGPLSPLLDLNLSTLDSTLATNLRGVAATIKHAGRAMSSQGVRGSIVCTASVAGCVGGVGPAAYTASKHAVVGLVRAAASELGRDGIRVNCVSPFGVATPMTCNAYNMEPSQLEASSSAFASLKGVTFKAKDVAQAALFLASDESAFITGHNLVLDGGFTATAMGTQIDK